MKYAGGSGMSKPPVSAPHRLHRRCLSPVVSPPFVAKALPFLVLHHGRQATADPVPVEERQLVVEAWEVDTPWPMMPHTVALLHPASRCPSGCLTRKGGEGVGGLAVPAIATGEYCLSTAFPLTVHCLSLDLR